MEKNIRKLKFSRKMWEFVLNYKPKSLLGSPPRLFHISRWPPFPIWKIVEFHIFIWECVFLLYLVILAVIITIWGRILLLWILQTLFDSRMTISDVFLTPDILDKEVLYKCINTGLTCRAPIYSQMYSLMWIVQNGIKWGCSERYTNKFKAPEIPVPLYKGKCSVTKKAEPYSDVSRLLRLII